MNPKFIILILLTLSFILFLRIFIYIQNIQDVSNGSKVTFESKIVNQPKISPRGQRASMMLPNNQRITVLFNLSDQLNYGDRVIVSGEIGYFEADNGNMVAYMDYPKFKLTEKAAERSFILKFREKIIEFFNSSLDPASASLMLGITFGIKQDFPEEFYLDLQKTGLMHVVAASGMNITMVGGFFIAFFSLFLRRQTALIISIIGILFYTVLAGFEASIVRAAVMGIIAFSAAILGRQSIAFLSLFFAGFAMLMVRPSLLFDIGFQLSFLATLGLVYLRPLFYLSKSVSYVLKKSVIGEDLTTTIAAQAATLPILLINFGSYSFWSVPINAVTLWTVPFLMIIGGISAILAILSESIGRLILYLSLPFLMYFEEVVIFMGERISPILIGIFPASLILGYYVFLIGVLVFIKNRR